MKTIVLITSLFFLYSSIVAQEITQDVLKEWQEAEAFIPQLLNNSNISYINQLGEANVLISIQQNTGDLSNSVILDQQGTGNTGYINQVGNSHFSGLTQNGSGNEASIWSVGQLTFTGILQNGDNNRINSYIDNPDIFLKEAILQQTGNNNSIDLALLGNGFFSESSPKAAVINQTGSNLEISAILDSYKSPIIIEQQSGPTGGMKIDVSNSAFNFPMK